MKTNVSSQDISIIILAGGRSKRMGTDKCLIKLNGKTLINIIISKAEQISKNILIIANKPEYNVLRYPTFHDIYANKGPIGGIYTGLFHSTTKTNLVLGCDLPNLTVNFLKFMLERHHNYREANATVPVYHEKIQPLAGVYEKHFLDTLKPQILAGKYKMKESLKISNPNYIKISTDLDIYSPYLFENLNTIEDLNKHKQLNIWK